MGICLFAIRSPSEASKPASVLSANVLSDIRNVTATLRRAPGQQPLTTCVYIMNYRIFVTTSLLTYTSTVKPMASAEPVTKVVDVRTNLLSALKSGSSALKKVDEPPVAAKKVRAVRTVRAVCVGARWFTITHTCTGSNTCTPHSDSLCLIPVCNLPRVTYLYTRVAPNQPERGHRSDPSQPFQDRGVGQRE
jgi:hypothetical protein